MIFLDLDSDNYEQRMISMTPLMKCGHKANSIDPNGEPVCVRTECLGIENSGYDEVAENE